MAYCEVDISFSKTISVFYASLGENARAARLAGNEEERKRWSGLLRELDEMIYAANQAGLDYFEREAGYTRSRSHAQRVDGQETGHFDEARLVMEQFLQHTSRDDDVHLHVHNVIATIAQTIMDGKWRTPDSWGYNEVFMAVSAIVSLHLEAAMRRTQDGPRNSGNPAASLSPSRQKYGTRPSPAPAGAQTRTTTLSPTRGCSGAPRSKRWPDARPSSPSGPATSSSTSSARCCHPKSATSSPSGCCPCWRTWPTGPWPATSSRWCAWRHPSSSTCPTRSGAPTAARSTSGT